MRSSLGGPAHNGRMACIHRHHRPSIPQASDGRQNARQFLITRNGFGARPGRFAANINDAGTGLDHRLAHRNSLRWGRMLAAIRKAIRRDIQNTHDLWFSHRQAGKICPCCGQLVHDGGCRVAVICASD